MNKKILIGSIFVLVLILLMPSIPAIQQKTIEEGIKQHIHEKLESVNLNDLKDIKKLDGVEFPLLFEIVLFITNLGFTRANFLWEKAEVWYGTGLGVIFYFFLYRTSLWYSITFLWFGFWMTIANKYGWNWDLPSP